MQFTVNRGSAQRNGFYYPNLVFYAESDSVNKTRGEGYWNTQNLIEGPAW